MHIEKVLVPVDLSPPSRIAVNYGVALARKLRSKLFLLHVVEPAKAFIHKFPEEGSKAEREEREQATRLLAALVAPEDQDDLDLAVIIKSGEVGDQICSTIRETGADFVVMGTHGRSTLRRWFIGSVTEGLLRKVGVPILTVCRVTQPLSFSRIMYATDLSESKRIGFDFVLDMAEMANAEVFVVHAIDQPRSGYESPEMSPYLEENRQYFLEQARAILADYVAEGRRRRVKVDTLVVEATAADAILHVADANNSDLIVITVHDKGLLERTFIGSTAERLIREAHVPVISIPVRKESGEGFSGEIVGKSRSSL